MADIILTTLNARYIHASLGLRYLLANMGELQKATRLLEFTINQRPADIVESLLAEQPRIIGLGVYVWNARESAEVVALLKRIRPDVLVVVGGPEVSYEYDEQAIVATADYLIPGQADLAFGQLCRRLLAGERPVQKLQPPAPVSPDQIRLPYQLYSDTDIAHRVLYVEASRGCPFRCEFCLSALDKTLHPFELARFLEAMAQLFERGARQFKFVDRTFNLKLEHAIPILEFFLQRLEPGLFLHFELIPDHLPERLKHVIEKFPAGSLQFEIGVQSFDPAVQTLISRRQDNDKSAANLRWLRENTEAHLHTDLIIGLPGEDMAGFGQGFDRLVALGPHEIQLGVLKRLRGAPVGRHSTQYDMRFNPFPPYNVLSTDRIGFHDMQRLARFARYWDLVANTGRFQATLPLLLERSPFARFLAFSDWLYRETGQTHRIKLERLFGLLGHWLTQQADCAQETATAALAADADKAGVKLPSQVAGSSGRTATRPGDGAARQKRHLH